MVARTKLAREAVRKQSLEETKKRKESTKRKPANNSKLGKLEFKVFREDEHDSYKQNSPSAITKLTQLPLQGSSGLTLEDFALFETIGSDLDRSMSIEDIIPVNESSSNKTKKLSEIPSEVQHEINRLPSWLQSMIIHKYAIISGHYKENTEKFFRAIGNRIEQRYPQPMYLTSSVDDDDEPSNVDKLNTSQVDSYKLNDDDFNLSMDKNKDTESAMAFRVAQAVDKWKSVTIEKDQNEKDFFDPTKISQVNYKLRSALQTRATPKDIMVVATDAEMLRVDEIIDENEEHFLLKRNLDNYWYNVFDKKHTIQAAEQAVEKYLSHPQKKRVKHDKEMNPKANNKLHKNRVRRCHGTHIFVTKHGKRKKKRILLTRGYFRDSTRLLNSNCGNFSKTPKRITRAYRCDGSFHQYCVALVTWFWFKMLVMFIIGVNAIVLALETYDFGETYAFYFEIIDNIFVAVYTVECVLKIYAYPYTYWRSGFNVFDFIILVASIIKNISDWTNGTEIDLLRALLIVRALRILRGISLSIQLQVLVSALIQTIRHHVLSVVLLLVLLLYVASIIAYYFFGKKYPEAFGTVGYGMLNMLRVLTIDGWTDLNENLSDRAGVSGILFMVMCIVLGNFLFSNIFVAIIIMNISESTDNFRDKQREKRETVVRMKKEKVLQRQKLDLRQLLSHQQSSTYTDFFSRGQQFEKLLRHDDLVAIKDIITSPLWIDSIYETMQKSNHTSTVLMNLHREMADNLLNLFRLYGENKMNYSPIRRARYNRYLRIKAKLALIKQEIMNDRVMNQPKTKMHFS